MRKRIPVGFYAVGALAAVLILVLILVLVPHSVRAEYVLHYSGEKMQGVVLRSEESVDLSAYEKLVFSGVTEGTQLKEDTLLGVGYKTGYVKNTLTNLRQAEEKIVAYQNESILPEYDDATVEQYDFSISVLINQMAAAQEGFDRLHSRLCELMEERASYVRRQYAGNTYLQDLYKDEKALTDSLSSWSDRLQASTACRISFYSDGLENILTPEAAPGISETAFRELANGEENSSAIRLVYGETWYALVRAEDASGYREGETYAVFIGGAEKPVNGVLQSINTDKKGSVLFFCFTEQIENFLTVRYSEFHVGERYEGLSVKTSYVKNSSVIIKDETGRHSVPVTVLYQDGKRAIVTGDELKQEEKVYNK